MNPPFNAPQQQPSPDPGRRLAHSASRHTLDRWVSAAARLLRPAGAVTLIWRADALASLLAALTTGFGAVTLLPIHPKPSAPAIRVLARAVKASRSPLSLLPGFILADEAGKPTAEAEAVLRGGASLPLARD
jgi:tRNA1(Val) A37 N6-methylase TrmN6